MFWGVSLATIPLKLRLQRIVFFFFPVFFFVLFTMSGCPFHHVWSEKTEGTAGQGSQHSSNQEARDDQKQQARSAPELASASTGKGGEPLSCPMGFGSASLTDQQQQQEAAACPLGFSSNKGPKLGQFNCLICK